MSDDPCECIWSHEAAMRRLLSMLRNSQSECTDGDCGTPSDGMFSGPQGMVMWSLLWGALALVLFLMRPQSMRARPVDVTDPAAKRPPTGDNNDNNGPPPPGIH